MTFNPGSDHKLQFAVNPPPWEGEIHRKASKGSVDATALRQLQSLVAPKPRRDNDLLSKDGITLCQSDLAKADRWREHLSDLFRHERPVDLDYLHQHVPQRPVMTVALSQWAQRRL